MNFRFVLHCFWNFLFFLRWWNRYGTKHFVLNEDTSKHIVQVLRMQRRSWQHRRRWQPYHASGGWWTGNVVPLISGRKFMWVARLFLSALPFRFLKNAGRFEWFLEKATELGVTEIIPLICERTEKQHARNGSYARDIGERYVAIPAMLASALREPVRFNSLLEKNFNGMKLIAHCKKIQPKISWQKFWRRAKGNKIILIGPEGDFTGKEIKLALDHAFIPVALGNTRLRTETAELQQLHWCARFNGHYRRCNCFIFIFQYRFI